MVRRSGCCVLALILAGGFGFSGRVIAADGEESVFSLAAAGKIDLRFIARSDAAGRLLVRNLTAGPLRIEIPAAFAAVPVLPQNVLGQPAGQNAQRPQAVGVNGRGNQNNNPFPFDFGNNRPGNGIFNLPPERVVSLDLECVCLEHGRPTPRSGISYRPVPLEEAAASAEAQRTLLRWSREGLDRRVVQAVVWHQENGLTWQELSEKRMQRLGRDAVPYFSDRELERAKRLAGVADATAQAARSRP